MQSSINLPDLNTRLSSYFCFESGDKELSQSPACSSLSQGNTCTLLSKAAILAQPKRVRGSSKRHPSTDGWHEHISSQGSLSSNGIKSSSVFKTQQLQQKNHTGMLQWSWCYHFSDPTRVEQERPHETQQQSVSGGADTSGKLKVASLGRY